ncbi:MAG: YCF48-related protein [Candidatus Kapaibacterium sp.]
MRNTIFRSDRIPIITAAIITIVSVVLSGCGKTTTEATPPPLRGVLTGKILDAISSVPISGAKVTFSSGKNTTFTDANGDFEVDSLPIGYDVFTIAASNYNSLTDSILIITDHLSTYSGFLTPSFRGWITGWQPVNSGSTAILVNACYATKNVIYVCGFGGTLLRSNDGGATWNTVTVPTQENLYGVHFFDAITGIIMGNNGAILRTTDGGLTWASGNGKNYNFRNLSFSDQFHGTAVGGIDAGATPVVYRTTDGGITWTDQSSSIAGGTEALYAIACASSTEAFTGGIDGQIFRSTDGGFSWTKVFSASSWLRSLFFTDQNSGTAVGADGTIRHTIDGGFTWLGQAGGTTSVLNNVTNSDPRHATITGEGGTILHTRTSGATWLTQSINGLGLKLNASAFADSVHGIIVGEGGTILTPVTQ